MDGWVTIGTKLDTKQLERDLKSAEAELRKYEAEATKLTEQKAKVQLDLTGYEARKQEINESTNAELQFAQTTEQVKFVLDEEQIALRNLKSEYSKQFGQLDSIDSKLKDNVANQERVKEKVRETNEQLTKAGASAERLKIVGELGKGFDSINSKIRSTVGSVIRWGLALISIRSIYGMLSSAASTLSSTNAQIGANIEYLRAMLASALQPVIERIINLVYTLLVYLNTITKSWFGIDLFANASAIAMNKASKSAGGVSKGLGKARKEAEEMNKQLAGFDEMNVLQDNTQAAAGGGGGGGAGAGGGGATLPSFPEVDTKWMENFLKLKDEVIAGLFGIAAGLLALKLGATPLQALGIALIIGGIAYAIEGLLKYLQDPKLANLGQMIQGIGIAILGVGILIGSVPVMIIGAITLLVATVIRYWEQIKGVLQGAVDWIFQQAANIGGIPGMMIETIGQVLEILIEAFDWVVKGVQDVVDGIIKIVKGFISGDMSMVLDGLKQLVIGLLEIILGLVTGFLGVVLGAVKEMWLAIGLVVTTFISMIIAAIKGLWDGIKAIVGGIAKWVNSNIITPVANFFKGLWNGIKSGVQGAYDNIKKIFGGIVDFFKGIINKIVNTFKNLGGKVGDTVGGAFKGVVNGVLGGVEKILNSPIKSINSMIGEINKIPGVSINKLSTFKLPRLAKGGIINQPGRGLPVGNAIAGERGAEGVIPLTDSQQMAMLGETIGKYININATVPVYVGNRQIAKEIKKINAEDDFAYNR